MFDINFLPPPSFTNLFDPPIIAQYIRIVPVVCRKACTLRMELVGCELNGCSEPMGMKSRLVSDRQITASSTFRTWGIEAFTWHPHYARLDKQGKTNAWTAASNNRSEWLQVDLQSPKKITGIITQGAKDFGSIQFVMAFKVAHSDDGQTWTIMKDETTKTDKVSPDETELIPLGNATQHYGKGHEEERKYQIEKTAPD
uniref:Lactadherin-like n=1 Tax=Seriola lalandi dorsalis TaxID=1841481 RepID=A0A3B4XF75_SERLL